MMVLIHRLFLLGLLHCLIVLAFSTDEIQIITSEETFLNGLSDRIQKWGMNDIGANYEVVAIMGSQSSGKSTLLNNLFGTNFTVMDPKERKRTTNGTWLSRDHTHNIIVMDVEGSDSNARRDDQNFERKSALFALTCSRVLIVSIWENQVGLYTGANLGLLSVIFEEYLALFGDSDSRIYHRPQIIFIIQAHSRTTSLENLAQTLTRDLTGVWERIAKPEALRDRSATDYFDFKFDSLPHLHLDSEHYKHRVITLRKRFVDRNSDDYIFKNGYSNPVLADGLEPYMRATWEKIRYNEKLNLPGQHELIARLMCDKISASLLEEYRPHITSKLSLLDNGQIFQDLRSVMQSWKYAILRSYDNDAGNYILHVFMEKRISLIQSFHVEISKLFYKQLKNVRHSLLADFHKELEDAMQKGDGEFTSFVWDTRTKYERRFGEAVEKVAIDEAEWEWEDDLQELQEGMTEKVKAFEKLRAVPHYDPDEPDIGLQLFLGVLSMLGLGFF